jgi:hypothetical protein
MQIADAITNLHLLLWAATGITVGIVVFRALRGDFSREGEGANEATGTNTVSDANAFTQGQASRQQTSHDRVGDDVEALRENADREIYGELSEEGRSEVVTSKQTRIAAVKKRVHGQRARQSTDSADEAERVRWYEFAEKPHAPAQ